MKGSSGGAWSLGREHPYTTAGRHPDHTRVCSADPYHPGYGSGPVNSVCLDHYPSLRSGSRRGPCGNSRMRDRSM